MRLDHVHHHTSVQDFYNLHGKLKMHMYIGINYFINAMLVSVFFYSFILTVPLLLSISYGITYIIQSSVIYVDMSYSSC